MSGCDFIKNTLRAQGAKLMRTIDALSEAKSAAIRKQEKEIRQLGKEPARKYPLQEEERSSTMPETDKKFHALAMTYGKIDPGRVRIELDGFLIKGVTEFGIKVLNPDAAELTLKIIVGADAKPVMMDDDGTEAVSDADN